MAVHLMREVLGNPQSSQELFEELEADYEATYGKSLPTGAICLPADIWARSCTEFEPL